MKFERLIAARECSNSSPLNPTQKLNAAPKNSIDLQAADDKSRSPISRGEGRPLVKGKQSQQRDFACGSRYGRLLLYTIRNRSKMMVSQSSYAPASAHRSLKQRHDDPPRPSRVSDLSLPVDHTRKLRASSQFLPHCASGLSRRSSITSWHPLHFCELRMSHGTAGAPRQNERTSGRSSALTSSAESPAESFGKEDFLPEIDESIPIEEDDKMEDIRWSILKLSLPGLGIVLSDPLMSLIDTGCVGQISSIQLASLGPNTLIFNFVFQVFGFLGTTTCNFIASTNRRFSSTQEQEKVRRKASRVLSQALFLAGFLGIAIGLLMEAFAPQLLLLMGATPDYMTPALTYLHIRALSVPAVLIILVGHGACLGRQDARTPLVVNFAAAAINLVGDLVLTLSAKWGVAGAAWATVFSQYVAVILLLRALMAKPQESTFEHSKVGSVRSLSSNPIPLEIGWSGFPSSEVLGEFYEMAVSLVLRCALSMVIYTSVGQVVARTGTLSLAAHQVAMQVFWFLSFFPEALSISAQSLIARDVKRYPERAHAVARLLLRLSLGFGVGLASIVAFVHSFGIYWLTADQTVATLVYSVTNQSMICSFLCAVAVVFEGIAIASGDLAYLSRMQLLNLAGMIIATITIHRAGWGLTGVWWSLAIYFASRVAYHVVHILTHWQTNVLGAAPVKLNAA